MSFSFLRIPLIQYVKIISIYTNLLFYIFFHLLSIEDCSPNYLKGRKSVDTLSNYIMAVQ